MLGWLEEMTLSCSVAAWIKSRLGGMLVIGACERGMARHGRQQPARRCDSNLRVMVRVHSAAVWRRCSSRVDVCAAAARSEVQKGSREVDEE